MPAPSWRRSQLALALLPTFGLLALLAVLRPWAHTAKPASLVLLLLDTLRADRLGCYGYPVATSPELDALARDGVRFGRVVSQAPWTKPSVASLFTSLHPRSLGILAEGEAILPDRVTTLAEALHEAGYRTLGATANPHTNRSFNLPQGFDVYLDSGVVWEGMRPEPGQEVASEPRFASAPELFARLTRELDAESPAERRAPHLLWLHAMEVHEHSRAASPLLRPESSELFPEVRDPEERAYLQVVRQLSADVGAFVAQLSRRPGFEDAIFAILSDHGEGLRSHPGVFKSEGHGRLLYESQLLVPWILYQREGALPRGLVVERPVRLLDVMPTLLALLGIEGPAEMRGASLLPLFEPGGEIELPRRFVVETHFRGHDKLGVYGPAWKLYDHRDAHPGTDRLELQAWGSEDGRRTDQGSSHPRAVARFSRFLARWERDHPVAEPTLRPTPLPEEEAEQLRALGYSSPRVWPDAPLDP
jgi:arylsulfatase A-like enzyme